MAASEHEPPTTYDHAATPRASAFLWDAIVAGVLLVLLLLTHGLGLFGSGRGAAQESPALVRQGERILVPDGSPLRQRLTVAPAGTQPVSGRVTAPGIVESDPARTVPVLPPGAGRVRTLAVALGDRVQRGQTLAIIDSPDLAQAFADNDKAASSARLAAANLTRAQAQFKIGATAQRDLDQSRTDNDQAVAEYARTRARLRAMGAAEEAPTAARLLTVRAPMPGSVIALAIAPGAVINDITQPVMSIADLSTVWVTAQVAEKDLAALAPGQDAAVDVAAYPGKTLHGKVLFVSDVLDADSRRNRTRIAFANPDYTLRPNMFATVTLYGPASARVVLPSSALLMNNDRTTVFVATAPWTFERRPVEPLLEESSQVTILSGVKPGEQVVVRGGILLND
ncbi:MAG: efflux RND transporter periplasmic adaptor subunit [Gammaproteobacteria bacterium]|nr:efflux RND transporter periplasmic adaptor subunit [Gammaproteobacteria bacterium]MBV9723754.1 efflux RND transporter periplasmic adaptor subunit [Gammaproteobacteria bacterium]